MAGIKGRSGRHTIKEQVDAYKELSELFRGKINISKLKKKIDSGKYAVKDMFLYKLLEGSAEFNSSLFRKLFPDSVIQDIQNRTEFEGIVLDNPSKSGDKHSK